MLTPEGKVKNEVKKVLKRYNAFFHMVVPCGYGQNGFPDFVACVPLTVTPGMVGKTIGVFVGIETKAPGKIKHTTPLQRRTLREIGEASGVAVVADDASQVEPVLDLLKSKGTTMTFIPE